MGSTGYSNDKSRIKPRHNPTLEEFVEAGFRPEDYPLAGYDAVESEGWTAEQARRKQADPVQNPGGPIVLADGQSAAPPVERRQNDESELSDEEKADLKLIEKLGGVEDQRTGETPGGEKPPAE